MISSQCVYEVRARKDFVEKNRRGSNHDLQLFNPICGCLWYPCCRL